LTSHLRISRCLKASLYLQGCVKTQV
jgi:hypothetical protein